MKRSVFTLLLCVLLIFSGCQVVRKPNKELCFYYLQSSIVYGSTDGVIAAENKHAPNEPDLENLIVQYLEGPGEPSLRSPFPANTRLVSVHLRGDTLEIQLSVDFSILTGMDRTLACACLAKTVFPLTTAEQVLILTEGSDKTMLIRRDGLTLWDDCNQIQETIGTEPADE